MPTNIVYTRNETFLAKGVCDILSSRAAASFSETVGFIQAR